MPPRLTLPAQRRLRRKSDFDATYARGTRLGNGLFSVTARANDQVGPRLGLAVAVKVAGNAVARNRIRRIIRESFRVNQGRLPAVDVVVSARARARQAAAAELRSGLESLWKEVAARCAPSPHS
jgi:ribonuclease P protein component